MEEPNPASLQLEEGTPREGGKGGSRVWSEHPLEEGMELPGERMQQRWEAQWQEFLKTLQSPSSAWGSLPPSEEKLWEDAKAFLASFEQVAKAYRWPKEEWAARLLPALSGEAEQAFRSLEARDREDYGKVKAAILRAEALREELQRQRFRRFCCQEMKDPRRVYSQVQELCSRWLKPERRSKEQILELLVLEQFLASLPQDLQGWVRGAGPETCSQAVALAEDFLLERQQEADSAQWQGPSQEVCVGSLEAEGKSPDATQGQIYEEANPAEDAEIPLLDGGIKYPNLSISVFPAEGQVETEAGLSEVVLDGKVACVTLHRIEQPVSQADQQTTFWQVLPAEGGNTQAIGDEMGCLKEMKVPLQVESSPAETSQRSSLMTSSIPKKRYPLRGRESKKLVETERKRTKSLIRGDNKASMDTGKPLFSKYGRKHHNVSDEFADPNSRKKDAECPEDGERSKSHRQSLQRPQNVPTGRKLQKSATSKNNFTSRGHLVRHQQSHTGQKPHQFSQCEKSFRWKNNLVRHQVIHTGVKPYKCFQCGKRFTLKYTLMWHQRIHAGRKPYKCSQCDKGFSRRVNLKRHQRIHTGEKPYGYSQCGKSFFRRVRLKEHEIIHTGEKPYECSQCDKRFSQRVNLKRHQRIHTGEKPYKCSQCDKGFTRKDSLKEHQRIHFGEKPYKCSQCGKSFGYRHSLKRHQRSHTGEKPYKCSQCGKCFTRRSSLEDHQRLHTRKKPR